MDSLGGESGGHSKQLPVRTYPSASTPPNVGMEAEEIIL